MTTVELQCLIDKQREYLNKVGELARQIDVGFMELGVDVKDSQYRPMFELKISTENAAFHDDAGGVPDEMAKLGEVRRILRLVSERIEAGETAGQCVDYNGNVVGSWKFTD